jgi:hypothetical protein
MIIATADMTMTIVTVAMTIADVVTITARAVVPAAAVTIIPTEKTRILWG